MVMNARPTMPIMLLEAAVNDRRQVIPSERGQNYPVNSITQAHLERYFQIKPTIIKPTIQTPGGAVGLIIFGAIIALVGLASHNSSSALIFLLGVAGVAGGIYWIQQAGEPLRTYLKPMEDYLLRETLSRDGYEAWLADKRRQISDRLPGRLDIEQDHLSAPGPTKQVIRDPLRIVGHISHTEPILSSTYFQSRLFPIADHVEYPGNVTHWRIARHFWIIPLDSALAVYETTIDATNPLLLDDSTSEYFYQAVSGIKTRLISGGYRSISHINFATEFSLLIDSGENPSITTSADLTQTIRTLRTAINEKKVLLLRENVSIGERVVPPSEEEMREFAAGLQHVSSS